MIANDDQVHDGEEELDPSVVDGGDDGGDGEEEEQGDM